MHFFDRARRFYGGNAIVGGGLPLAIGIAMADKQLRPGAVTACFFGEGAVGEGEFHESLNVAELWDLPVLFVCENNLYAMGVPLEIAEAETDIFRKAAAYRTPAEKVDGMNPIAVEAAARKAVESIRAGNGPFFLECRTYRFRAHSMFDAQLYRTREEIELWKERDPIPRTQKWLEENHMVSAEDLREIEAAVDAEIEAAVAFAEESGWEDAADLERFVLMDEVPA
jgi:TPP-dependent pyruvate/acetoin dehydrogenase alpha subunit